VRSSFVPFNVTEQFFQYDPLYGYRLEHIEDQLRALAPLIKEKIHTYTNITCIIEVFDEIKTLLASTADFEKIHGRLTYLNYLLELPDFLQPKEHQDPVTGAYGTCFQEFWLKLEVSSDVFLSSTTQPKYHPAFLDPLNDAVSLINYLESRLVSDVPLTGWNYFIQLNDDVANLLRLIIRDRPVGYNWRPELKDTIINFIKNVWRDPVNAYWGPWYTYNDTIVKIPDLSSTFHMISYLKGQVPDWPGILNTTFQLKQLPFPGGWFGPNGTYWNHNDMDIVTIFSYGWNETTPDIRVKIAHEIQQMLTWTLTNSLLSDGSFKVDVIDDSPATADILDAPFWAELDFSRSLRGFGRTRPFQRAKQYSNLSKITRLARNP